MVVCVVMGFFVTFFFPNGHTHAAHTQEPGNFSFFAVLACVRRTPHCEEEMNSSVNKYNKKVVINK